MYIDYNNRKQLYKHKNKIYCRFKDIKINVHNKKYIKSEIKKEICVNGFKLDSSQKEAIVSDEINTLVIAGAGSGKSLTIIGKINYLVNRGIDEKDILCISLTNDACNSLKNKMNYKVEVLTFHRFALNIINCKNYKISSVNYLDYIINEYFNCTIYNNYDMIQKVIDISNKNITYDDYIKTKEFIQLKRTISTFINLFKANGYKLESFCQIDVKSHNKLLSIIIDIYILYEQELKSHNMIDFDDMLDKATNYLNTNVKKLSYKYVIIDEFQDTSLVKLHLIKAIVNNCGAKTFVVGDDFQSIYKFTGCSLDLFLNYSKYIGHVKTIKITHTYRNSIQLTKVANKFILKNKHQIKKQVKSNITRSKPIKIVNYKANILDKIFDYLIDHKEKNILLLGRNNSDIQKYLNSNITIQGDIVKYKDTELNIRYLTVHKSKGLEEECVVVLNLYDDLLGFPCKIKNPDILSLISEEDKVLYEEERRLFYVCLTRTKKDIYLICPINISAFVIEIINNCKKYIEYLDL